MWPPGKPPRPTTPAVQNSSHRVCHRTKAFQVKALVLRSVGVPCPPTAFVWVQASWDNAGRVVPHSDLRGPDGDRGRTIAARGPRGGGGGALWSCIDLSGTVATAYNATFCRSRYCRWAHRGGGGPRSVERRCVATLHARPATTGVQDRRFHQLRNLVYPRSASSAHAP
jgi:hypothetical protein